MIELLVDEVLYFLTFFSHTLQETQQTTEVGLI